MQKFVWTDEYSLGINVIDEQHKHFFEIVNNIYDMLESTGDNRQDLIDVIDELAQYAYFHLATEEKYFNQFAYSDIANHMRYHAIFRQKSEEYTDRVKSENEDLPQLAQEVTDFSKNWLSNHILVADKLYAPFFKAHHIN